MIGKTIHLLSLSKYLLAFIFCGVILGETISLSMVVTAFGSEMVGRLYLVNALLLLLLPPVFFRYIDRINRGKLLAKTALVVVIILSVFAVLYNLFSANTIVYNIATVIVYPVAYLSKTLLFLTFWTCMNDIYNIKESKKNFPIIAAWGFSGAITGVVIARILVALLSINTIFILWVAVYYAAWILAKNLRYTAKRKLRPVEGENIPETKEALYGISVLLRNKLVVIIAIIYFGTFLAIFTMDFLFWKRCYVWCKTADAVASFQFTFFIIHAGVTVLFLRFVLPSVINKIGLTRVMYGLPVLFIFGGILMFAIEHQQMFENKMIFFATVQFFRHILFELTFATSYQVFFAAVVKEQRGRAKTLLEGIVKPSAIFTSGAIVVLIGGNVNWLMGMIILLGLLLSSVIYYLRFIYIKTIMKQSQAHMEISEIIDLAGQAENAEFYHIVKGYADSELEDMRIMAVQLLGKAGTSHAFSVLVAVYEKERSIRIKEMIARTMSVFYSYRTRAFIERLLLENNHRVRANAIFALNQMQCNWKKYCKPLIAPFLFENDQRVQLETAIFLWRFGTVYDKNTVQQFLKNLCTSTSSNRLAAGIYLAGVLQSAGWEKLLLEHLKTASTQVFTKSLEVIFQHASMDVIQKTLSIIDGMPRRNISIAGHIIMKTPLELQRVLMHYFPNVISRRFSFEIITCLRKAADVRRLSGKEFHVERAAADSIKNWILKEIEIIYCDAYHLHTLLNDSANEDFHILQNFLRERQTRLCVWAISAMVITDTKGILVWRSSEMDINEEYTRNDLIEVLESIPQDKVCSLILPLLKTDSWETLYRTGKVYFHFDRSSNISGVEYFLRSENRMIVLGMLYILEMNYSSYANHLKIKESLVMLENNYDDKISSAANELLNEKQGNVDKHSRAFELLERVLFFKKCALFHNINADKLLRIVELAHLVRYRKDETISIAGHVSDQVFIVKSGKVRIERQENDYTVVQRYVSPGDLYGEDGLFSKISRPTSALAEDATEIYILKRNDIRRLVREIPDIALNFLETISTILFTDRELALKNKRNSYSAKNK